MYFLSLSTCALSARADGLVSEVSPHVRQTTPWRQRGCQITHSDARGRRSGRSRSEAEGIERIKAIFASRPINRRCTP